MHWSSSGIVQSVIDVKRWQADFPSVDAVRPGSCPACRTASRPPGGGLRLHGHGRRSRDLRGPLEVGGPPVETGVMGRRYECQSCGAVILVVPRGVLARRRYPVPVIAFALALWGLCERPAAEVRQAVSPWRIVGDAAAVGWTMPARWAQAAASGRIFARVSVPDVGSRRAIASAVASRVCGHAPPHVRGAPVTVQAWAGSVQAV